jgi:tetratricopeptide (TPR) repeat protein
MGQDSVRQSQYEANAGIAALRHGRKEEAGLHFWRALQCLYDVQDLKECRDLLSEIAEFFFDAGLDDLALMAVQDAMEADERLGLDRGLIKDCMTYANIHTRLENLEHAEAMYRSLLERSLKNGDYANAASASTNLAGILANNNYLKEAVKLLENSLEYLASEAFPDTEIKTRFMLIQVLELQNGDSGRTFDVARTLLDRSADHLPSQYRDVLVQCVDSALERYTADHADVDPEVWKKRRFPELYGA